MKMNLKNLNKITDYSKEDILGMMGLAPKRDTLDVLMPALGLFGLGLVVGAGLGVLFAPKKGTELRTELTGKVNEQIKALKEKAPETFNEVSV